MTTPLHQVTLAAIRRMLAKTARLIRVADRESLAAWAQRHFHLDADSSHQVGAWVAWPFQVGIMEWMSDDRIQRVYLRKSKRVGYTKILTALICYYAEHLRRKVALWQPTDDDRDTYVRTELEPVLEEIRVMRDARRRGGSLDTLKLKQFVGSIVHLLGGKAARAYRRITVDLAVLDEWSAFDESVEGRGDPGLLAQGRLEGAAYPKFVGGSTPSTKGACQVTISSDEAPVLMRYHVECPHCGMEHPLTTGFGPDGKPTAHGLHWTPGRPETTVHLCPHCLQPMTRAQYMAGGLPMAGEWVCIKTGIRYKGGGVWLGQDGSEIRPPADVAAHIWSAYSPQRSWESIAKEQEAAVKEFEAGNPAKMIVLVNETYGEAWEATGDRVDEHALSLRPNKHSRGAVPIGALILTAGIDVQADRIEIGVWGWGIGMQSWVIDHHIIEGNPSADDSLWDLVAIHLQRRYRQQWHGGAIAISSISIDSGYATHAVYAFVREQAGTLPIRAIAGSGDAKMLIKGPARPQDVNWRGQKWIGGVKRWEVGTKSSEDLLHGQLGLEKPGPGFVNFCDRLPQEWYAQLTGKTRVPVRTPRGLIERWIRSRPRVEVRDCRRYAHHAALCLGLDSYSAAKWTELKHQVQPPHDLFSAPPPDLEPETSTTPAPPSLPPAPALRTQSPAPRPRIPRAFGG